MPPQGVVVPGWQPPMQPKKKETYAASIEQQAKDYDEIMNRYRQYADRVGQQPNRSLQDLRGLASQYQQPYTGAPYTGATYTGATYTASPAYTAGPAYRRSSELEGAFGNLSDLARTGGYSGETLANIRARGVSPLRSVYANAQRNLQRQRALQGGYSPNMGAITAKMAREQGQLLSQAIGDIEAGIGERVAQGRLSVGPQLAELAARENALRTQYEQAEAARQSEYGQSEATRRTQYDQIEAARKSAYDQSEAARRTEYGQTEAGRRSEYDLNRLNALQSLYGQLAQAEQTEGDRGFRAAEGMRALYGTTPALPALYGQQAVQQAALKPIRRPAPRGGISLGGLTGQYQPNTQIRLG